MNMQGLQQMALPLPRFFYYMTFQDLGIAPPILAALEKKGYTLPTPIQQQAIPILLAGKDLMGCAQTGTGKTAAFAIPIIQHLHNNPTRSKQKRAIKALVVTPTRELAIQIADNFIEYGAFANIKTAVIFGGVKQHSQVEAIKRGVDVLIATPGRLLDLMNQGYVSLREIAHFVLDEADQMLDMGFIHDIKKLLTKLPNERQSLFFSATMPAAIVELSGKILKDYERVTIKPQQATAERVEQGVYFVAKADKPELLTHLIKSRKPASVLVFTRTKHGADKVVKMLSRAKINAAAIHGNKSQNNRQASLNAFKDGQLKVLIATDIAARGIDVSDLELVINYDLPNVPETYVHRIGRTGRASASGTSLSFCDVEERPYLKDIEKLIKQQIPVMDHHLIQAVAEKPETRSLPNYPAPAKVMKPKKSQWRGPRRPKKQG
jgi:ATP-dependent RNA helicase RhlE